MTILSLIPACAAQGGTLAYAKGDQIQDFTFTTYRGEQFSLYEILAEKEAVLINVWATWCGPCRNEFPYLQEAYGLDAVLAHKVYHSNGSFQVDFQFSEDVKELAKIDKRFELIDMNEL